MAREDILNQISIERDSQERRYGKENAKCSLWQLMNLFTEEFGECAKALNDAYDWRRKTFEPIPLRQLKQELIQAAAMAVQIVERLDYGLGIQEEVVIHRGLVLEQIARGARIWRTAKEHDELMAALSKLDELEGVSSAT